MTERAIWQSDAVALADRIGALFASIRSAEAELGALLIDIEQRGVLELFGYRSVPRLLEHLADVPGLRVARPRSHAHRTSCPSVVAGNDPRVSDGTVPGYPDVRMPRLSAPRVYHVVLPLLDPFDQPD